LVVAETTGEFDGRAGHQIGRIATVQFKVDPELSLEGRVPVVLAIHLTLLGRCLSRQMVYENNAVKD
jgi:hypothetical protein